MSGGGVYLRDGENLIAMREEPYATEALLQKLLADHPDLLAGDQGDPESPRRWLLVSQELSLATEEDGSGRWYVDHLFIDGDAVPTLVEVKRSSDTRIRREVVGQMLDYAANAVVYWNVEKLRAAFDAQCAQKGADPDEVIATMLALILTPRASGSASRQIWRPASSALCSSETRSRASCGESSSSLADR